MFGKIFKISEIIWIKNFNKRSSICGKFIIPGNKVNNLENAIYSWIKKINHSKSKYIIENYPKISRRVSGYNLDEITDKNHLNLAGLLVGSEGTLGIITEIQLRIYGIPESLEYKNVLEGYTDVDSH